VTGKDRPPGSDSRGPEDDAPPTASVAVIVTEDWLRRNGHQLAADERARQMRIARIRLDRLLYGEPRRGCWQCPGEFGPDGRFREHCGPVSHAPR
jgi:hypothetical protein